MGDSLVQKAIDLASAPYSAHQWLELPTGHRSAAIYRELRRLDAATLTSVARTARQSHNAPVEVLHLHAAKPAAAPQRDPMPSVHGWRELRRA
jgi:hypothetical protein